MTEHPTIRKRRIGGLILLFLLGVAAACEKPKAERPQGADPGEAEVERHFSRGGAPVQVKVRLSKERIALTDRLAMTLLIEHSEDVRIVPPFLSEAVYAPLLLIEKPRNEVRWSQDNQFLIDEWHYVFEPVESGEFAFNAFTVFFRLNGERTPDIADWPVYKIPIDPISYRVFPVELDPAEDIRDIKGFILPGYDYITVVAAIAVILILDALVFAFLLYYRRLGRKRTAAAIPMDYRQLALDELDRLERKDLIGKRAFDRLHTELSAILRRYLETCFQIKAQEQTTEEFIFEISESKRFTGEWRNMLQQFLRLADLVKFATFEPGTDVSRGAIKDVRTFIKKTGKPHGV